MKYEIVELEQKTVVGKSIETSNSDADMGQKIGNLWMQLYDSKNGYYSKINNKATKNAIGLYSDYNNEKYLVTVGAEVSQAANPEMSKKVVIKGRYAKFGVHGNMITAVAKAWQEIWNTELDRSFTGDFEEYIESEEHIENCNVDICEDCNINIYVALK